MTVETTIDLARIETRRACCDGCLRFSPSGSRQCFSPFEVRWQTGVAFVVGCGLGVLNFHWLWQMGSALMDIDSGRVPHKTVVLLVARYPLAFGGLALLYLTGWLPLTPVILGMLIPCAGVFLESLLMLGLDFGHKQAA